MIIELDDMETLKREAQAAKYEEQRERIIKAAHENQKIKINLDTVRYNDKPEPFPPSLRTRLCNAASLQEITPEELIEAVQQGRTFTPAALTGTTGDTWQSQQIICADIDNDEQIKPGEKRQIDNPMTPEKARAVMAEYGIEPYFMYYSFSNSESWPKFRICVILEEPLTDPGEAYRLKENFTGIFNAAAAGCADTSAKDHARIYFGCRPGGVFYTSKKTTSRAKLEALPDNNAAEAPKTPPKAPERAKATDSAPKGIKRQYDELQAQFEHDKESFDLAGYVLATSGSRPKRSGKSLFFNPCPICGHNDDFQITGSLWHCHSASDGRGGTIIDYLMIHDGLELGEACDKFKFAIMGYDREEWREAWKEQNEFEIIGLNEANEEPATDPGQEEPQEPEELRGLLTFDRAVNVLKNADDRILEMKSFPEFSKIAKIGVHDSVIFAADTGGGKSSLALNFLNDLNETYPCIYFNLEMDFKEVLRRMTSIYSGMPLDMIEGYQQDERTAEAVNITLRQITSRKPLQVFNDVFNLAKIEKLIIQAEKGRTDPTIVIIDHSILVQTGNKGSSDRYARFTEVSERLRTLTKTHNIIMFVLLQQNRAGKKDENEPPRNDSLKESGSWENDASHIFFLWKDPELKPNQRKIIMTKNRHGKCSNFVLNYWSDRQTYQESKDEPQQAKKPQKLSKREKQRQKLETAYRDALRTTGGHPTLRAMAEAADVTTTTIKSWLKEYGGCTIDGERMDPAGIDTEIEYDGFIKLTPADNEPFDEPEPAQKMKRI